MEAVVTCAIAEKLKKTSIRAAKTLIVVCLKRSNIAFRIENWIIIGRCKGMTIIVNDTEYMCYNYATNAKKHN